MLETIVDGTATAMCRGCGSQNSGEPGTRVSCRACGAIVELPGAKITVTGPIATDVKDVLIAAVAEHREAERARSALRGPWVSGSFYLVALVALLSVLLVAGAVLPIWVIPLVIIGGLVGVSAIGALQLRQDEKLSEKGFVELMRMTLAKLPLLMRLKDRP